MTPPSSLAPIQQVWSLYFPETREVVSELWAAQKHELYDRAWERENDRPDLDFLAEWAAWSKIKPGPAFHGYTTNGASEAIKDIIATVRPRKIHTFLGDYEGYSKVGAALGVGTWEHTRGAPILSPLGPSDLFFISDPSSIDGEHWGGLEAFIDDLHARNPLCRVVVDLTYAGLVKKPRPPLSLAHHPNVWAVIFSLSKPFGVYRHRIGGVFCRNQIPVLYGNRWFNNAFSLYLGRTLLERYPQGVIPRKYAAMQEALVADLIRAKSLPPEAVPSNTLLLARSPAGAGDPKFARGGSEGPRRYCLTTMLREKMPGGSLVSVE